MPRLFMTPYPQRLEVCTGGWTAPAAVLLGTQSHCFPWGLCYCLTLYPDPCSWRGCLCCCSRARRGQWGPERSVGSGHLFAPASGSLTSHLPAAPCPLCPSVSWAFLEVTPISHALSFFNFYLFF